MDEITFRRFEFNDMHQMCLWLNTDHVKQWYEKKSWTIDDVISKYKVYVTGEKPIKAYIILFNGIEIGYIQTYNICDYPDYNKYVQTDEHSAGVDLFIGNINYVHKGHGVKVLKDFLKDYVFIYPNIDKCIIGPEPQNISAIRMYEKAGFVWYKNIHILDEDEIEYLMILSKKDFYLKAFK